MKRQWIGLNIAKLTPSPPLDLKLGYCTRHGYTTVCPECELEIARQRIAELEELAQRDSDANLALYTRIAELEEKAACFEEMYSELYTHHVGDKHIGELSWKLSY